MHPFAFAMVSDEHRVDDNYSTITSSSSTLNHLCPTQDQHEDTEHLHHHSIRPESPECINDHGNDIIIPQDFICPITLQVMVHPLTTRNGLSF